jgi:hypothetical protein
MDIALLRRMMYIYIHEADYGISGLPQLYAGLLR